MTTTTPIDTDPGALPTPADKSPLSFRKTY